MTRIINKADEGELLKAHYRVSFNKDGSVHSCDRVEGPKNDRGGYIQYVQADSKEEAIAKARKAIDAYLKKAERRRENSRNASRARAASGICARCDSTELVTKYYCAKHNEEQNERHRELNRRKKLGEPMAHVPLAKRSEGELLSAALSHQENQRSRIQRRNERRKSTLGSGYRYDKTNAALKFAELALEKYDKCAVLSRHAMPEFRAWLVSQAESLRGKIRASYVTHEAAAAE